MIKVIWVMFRMYDPSEQGTFVPFIHCYFNSTYGNASGNLRYRSDRSCISASVDESAILHSTCPMESADDVLVVLWTTALVDSAEDAFDRRRCLLVACLSVPWKSLGPCASAGCCTPDLAWRFDRPEQSPRRTTSLWAGEFKRQVLGDK